MGNNQQKMVEQRQRYALCKYTVGVVSFFVGALLLGGTAGQAHADTADQTENNVPVSQPTTSPQPAAHQTTPSKPCSTSNLPACTNVLPYSWAAAKKWNTFIICIKNNQIY